mgnify:CR=1 FL=1
MTFNEAKIGAFVCGNNPDKYFFTNNKMTLGVIVEINESYIYVMILRHTVHTEKIHSTYEVNPKHFDVVDISDITFTEEERHILDLMFNKSFDIGKDYNMYGYTVVRRYGDEAVFEYESRSYCSAYKIMSNLT